MFTPGQGRKFGLVRIVNYAENSHNDAVLEDVRTWQSRPLDLGYPILYFDCLFVKSRQEGVVKTKVVYVAFWG